jgi:hypothetical protein
VSEETLAKLALRELGDDDMSGLDPARVIAGAKRRRSRNLAMTAIASVAVAAVAVGGSMAAGAGGGEPQVAGFGSPSGAVSSTPSVPTQPKASASPSAPGVVPSTQFSQPIPGPRSSWTAGGPIGAKPIGTIPAGGKVEIAAKYWFETRGTKWCITESDDSPSGTNEPFGCRGTVGNANIGDGRVPGIQASNDANGHKVVTSVFRGDARRAIYTDGDKFYEAKLYRIAAVPGWMMAVASYEQPKGDSTGISDASVFVYDAGGKVSAQFPLAKDGGPKTNPLG